MEPLAASSLPRSLNSLPSLHLPVLGASGSTRYYVSYTLLNLFTFEYFNGETTIFTFIYFHNITRLEFLFMVHKLYALKTPAEDKCLAPLIYSDGHQCISLVFTFNQKGRLQVSQLSTLRESWHQTKSQGALVSSIHIHGKGNELVFLQFICMANKVLISI